MSFSFGPLGQTARAVLRLFHRGWEVEGVQPAEPCVYLIHHQNLAGPIRAEVLLPASAHVWALHVFLDRSACFRQYYGYTFTRRFGWPRGLAAPVCGLLALVIPALMKSIGAVPVYRGVREIRATMARSQALLREGASLLICPDTAYSDTDGDLHEMYTGFLHLEKPYFKGTGQHLAFVPLYASARQKRLVICPPIRFADGQPYRQERDRVARAIRAAIHETGLRCGDLSAGT